jgi:hypothetical protein
MNDTRKFVGEEHQQRRNDTRKFVGEEHQQRRNIFE